jgi:hypothetical protein
MRIKGKWSGLAMVVGMCVGVMGQAAAGPMNLEGQFAVNQSGAATYTIPIQVPPGIAGIEPKLSLNYNSQSGNGLLGVGWSLGGLSAITRCPRTMAQDNVRGSVNFDLNDRYCLDGQRLIAINGADGGDGTEYRTEVESYSKIISYGSAGNGPAWFKVWTKSGQIVEYGNTADSRIEAIKAVGSNATWPSTTVRAWVLNKISDTKGNYLTYTYTEDTANGDYYPQRIDYTGNATTGQATTNSVLFAYEARPDVLPFLHNGSSSLSSQRLKTVSVSSLSLYQIDYLPAAASTPSRLSRLRICVAAQQACLLDISPNWSDASAPVFTKTLAPVSVNDWDASRAWSGDYNGDGKTDLLSYYNGQLITFLSNGDGTYSKTLTHASFNGRLEC